VAADALKGTAATTTTAAGQTTPTGTPGFEATFAILGLLSVLLVNQ